MTTGVPEHEGPPIARATEGMRVVDSAGSEVGTVEAVRMGDPEAVATEGQWAGEPIGLLGAVTASITGDEPHVPGPLAEWLLRVGYIKIDPGLLGPDRYSAADEVAYVAEGVVTLSVPAETGHGLMMVGSVADGRCRPVHRRACGRS